MSPRAFPEPTAETGDPAVLFARYFQWCRETVIEKVESLPEVELRTSRLPSGWTPIELLSPSGLHGAAVVRLGVPRRAGRGALG